MGALAQALQGRQRASAGPGPPLPLLRRWWSLCSGSQCTQPGTVPRPVQYRAMVPGQYSTGLWYQASKVPGQYSTQASAVPWYPTQYHYPCTHARVPRYPTTTRTRTRTLACPRHWPSVTHRAGLNLTLLPDPVLYLAVVSGGVCTFGHPKHGTRAWATVKTGMNQGLGPREIPVLVP